LELRDLGAAATLEERTARTRATQASRAGGGLGREGAALEEAF
jgi:hypothetical protein